MNQNEVSPDKESAENLLSEDNTSISASTRKLLMFLFGLILLIIFSTGAFFLGKIASKKELKTSTTVTVLSSPTPAPSNAKYVKYEHPQLHYKLNYPLGWIATTEELAKRRGGQVYSNFTTRSSDFQVGSFDNDGKHTSLKGGLLTLSAEQSIETNITDLFDKDELAKSIAFNKSNITVADVQAIQYDFSYEAAYGTVTVLLKNGVYYQVIYYYGYGDNAGKQTYWNEYSSLLQSFE